jgi:hypothetical protein
MNEKTAMVVSSAFLKKNKYITSNIIDSTEKIKWIPVLECGVNYRNMGFTQKGVWVLEEINGIRVLGESRLFLKIVALLERPWH